MTNRWHLATAAASLTLSEQAQQPGQGAQAQAGAGGAVSGATDFFWLGGDGCAGEEMNL